MVERRHALVVCLVAPGQRVHAPSTGAVIPRVREQEIAEEVVDRRDD
jgi:hypothetical protein